MNPATSESGGGTPRGPRLSPEDLALRENDSYRLRLLGKSSAEIGARFGVSDRHARRYIEAGKERAIRELRELNGRAGVMRQFTILNHVLDEALDAWEKSKAKQITRTANMKKTGLQKGSDALDGVTAVEQRTGQKEVEQVGDPAWLDRALKASAEIRLLLGLDAPTVKRLLLSEDPIARVNDADLHTLPADELLRLYRSEIGLGAEVEL